MPTAPFGPCRNSPAHCSFSSPVAGAAVGETGGSQRIDQVMTSPRPATGNVSLPVPVVPCLPCGGEHARSAGGVRVEVVDDAIHHAASCVVPLERLDDLIARSKWARRCARSQVAGAREHAPDIHSGIEELDGTGQARTADNKPDVELCLRRRGERHEAGHDRRRDKWASHRSSLSPTMDTPPERWRFPTPCAWLPWPR
jgi:hypothetical protein